MMDSMAQNSLRRFAAAALPLLAVACHALLLVVAITGHAQAREIRGTVVNGTTGKPVGPVKVTVVDPRHGMATEGEIRTDARGVFAAAGLRDDISMFLVQVSHEGVTYTEIVQPSSDTVEVEVKVYETTTSWDGLRVSLPHFLARRSLDTLSIDRVFVVSNETQPPKTVFGPGAGFRLSIPEERLQITSLFATSLGFPINVEPHPTDTPGLYTVDYPFKPGNTQVGVSFDVAYPESGYVYSEALPYPIDEAVLMTEDTEMEVASAEFTLPDPEEIRGHKAYRWGPIPQSSKLTLAFRGGSARARPEPAGHQIVTLRDLDDRATIALIAAFTLLLVLVLAVASRSPSVDVDPSARLTAVRNSTLNKIARLDDLFEMGAVTDVLYREKRAELVESLSRIIRRIDDCQHKAARNARKRKGTSDGR
jgi:hypothetical protein